MATKFTKYTQGKLKSLRGLGVLSGKTLSSFCALSSLQSDFLPDRLADREIRPTLWKKMGDENPDANPEQDQSAQNFHALTKFFPQLNPGEQAKGR